VLQHGILRHGSVLIIAIETCIPQVSVTDIPRAVQLGNTDAQWFFYADNLEWMQQMQVRQRVIFVDRSNIRTFWAPTADVAVLIKFPNDAQPLHYDVRLCFYSDACDRDILTFNLPYRIQVLPNENGVESPCIVDVSHSAAPRGTQLWIHGERFDSDSVVYFGDAQALVVFSSTTLLKAVIPSGVAKSSVSLCVVNASVGSNKVSFTFG